jgi:uncharacterized protein (TIGR02453 family)
MSGPCFPRQAVTFLRALARNNNREWFQARKGDYETRVRAPMVSIIEQLDRDFRAFAPELATAPKVSLFRIHRDTRFSADKSPYKTQVAAVFPHRSLGRLAGAALYFHVAPREVMIAGGVYAPTSPDLLAVRTHIAENLARFRSIVLAPGFRRVTGGLTGAQSSRVPRGFAADHPAVEYLRYKQFLAVVELPATDASSPSFYTTLLRVFRAIAPLVRFLNEPLTHRPLDPLR